MITLLQEWLEVLSPLTDLHEDIALTVQHMSEELNDLLVDKAEYEREEQRDLMPYNPLDDWDTMVNNLRRNDRNLK